MTSGTATLETALLGCPMVIAYKVSALTYVLGRMLITGVDFIGMPNILAGRKIVPELIQGEMTANNLVRAGEPLLSDTIHRETTAALHSLRELLGAPGAAARVAAIALEMFRMKLFSPMHRRLFNYLRPYLFPYTALLGVSMLVLAGANAGIPFVIKNFVNDMTRAQGASGLHMLSFMLAGLFLLRAGGNLTDDYLSAYISQKLMLDMRADLNESLQRQSLSFFNRTPTGMMVSRVLNDVNVVVQTLSNGVFSLFGDGLSLVALVAAAFYMDWQLALVAFVGFPLTIGPIVSFSKRVRKETKNAQKQLGGLQALLQETFQGNRVVKAFGMEDYERAASTPNCAACSEFTCAWRGSRRSPDR